MTSRRNAAPVETKQSKFERREAEIAVMVTREKKSAVELKALIMREVKRHPEWHDIQDVAITRRQRLSHQPNWDAAFTMTGPRATPEGAFRFAKELGAKFDLA
jgi:hypothetical protein